MGQKLSASAALSTSIAAVGAMRVVVVAGTHSGVGKTSLSVGLMLALRARGLTVQAFKVGPDFLDPMWHAAATGRPSINLDSFMLNREQLLASFHRHAGSADMAVVEGVMGAFDGRDGSSEEGSTAQVAKWLGAPVLLVVDCWAMARSAAALVKGYAEFDPELQLRGLLLNKVGGAAHGTWLKDALAAAVKLGRLAQPVEVLGCIPKDAAVAVPERYLGLMMPHEQQPDSGWQDRLCELVTRNVDLDRLLQLAAAQQPHLQLMPPPAAVEAAAPGSSRSQQPRCRIAVARDEAFCFYYHDNLALLEAAGAELAYFSPLADTALPQCSGVYLGGGYPERFAGQLSRNAALLRELREFAAGGGVVYAECGGLVYLSRGFWSSGGDTGDTAQEQPQQQQQPEQQQGNSEQAGRGEEQLRLVPLAGILPFTTRLAGMKMGYVSVQVQPDNPLFPAGCRIRGQVYHFSEVVPDSSSSSSSSAGSSSSSGDDRLRQTYELLRVLPGAVAEREGFAVGNVLASYVHLHWGGCPQMAETFVAKCCSSSSGPRGGSSGGSSSDSGGGSSSIANGRDSSIANGRDSGGSSTAAGGDGPSSGGGPTGAQAAGNTTISHSRSSGSRTASSCCCCCGDAAAGACSSAGSSRSNRIVSLLPSGTEILFALGCGDRLVGVSAFCDFPPAAANKAVASRSLVDVASMTSDEIEAAMQGFKASGQSPFSIDVELLRRERPGLLLTQDACGTCDADCSLVCQAMQAAGLSPQSTQVLVLHPKTLAEVLDSITAIGRAAGVEQRASDLVQELRRRLAAVAAAVTAACPPAAALIAASSGLLREQQPGGVAAAAEHLQAAAGVPGVPRVLSLEGLQPLVLGGQWLPDLKLAAGCCDASGQLPGAPPARITWQQVLDFAPDVLLLSPCSRSPAAAMPDVQQLLARHGFAQLPAAQAGRVFVADHAWFSRPGPRLVAGVELLARLVHGVGSNDSGGLAAASGGRKPEGSCSAAAASEDDGVVEVLRLEHVAAAGSDGGTATWVPHPGT